MRLLLPLLASACSSYAEPDVPEPTDGYTPIPTDTATPVLPEDAWLGLSGRAVVDADGAWSGGEIVASVYSRDPATSATVAVCQAVSPVEGPLEPAVPPSDDDEVFGLWTVPLVDSECPGIPADLVLGIGPLPSVLWPVARDAQASIRLTRGLYGVDRGELVVFGLAGTAAQRAGRGTPASLVPLPPGDYELSGAYLLPLLPL